MDISKQIINPTSFAIIFIVCFFLYLTRKSWQKVTNKAVIKFNSKWLSINTGQEQGKVQINKIFAESKKAKKLYKTLNLSNEKIKKLEENGRVLLSLWKFYMFSYLNLFLVPVSKLSLLWLGNNTNTTKEMFKINMRISPDINNQDIEKEAIFNALASNNLISKNSNDLYSITNIGRDFLIFIGLTS